MTGTTENGNSKRTVLKPDINAGTIITWFLIAAGFAVSWGAMAEKLTNLAKQLDAVRAEEVHHEQDIRVHYMIGSPAEMKLDQISINVEVMKAQLDESNRLLREHMKASNK